LLICAGATNLKSKILNGQATIGNPQSAIGNEKVAMNAPRRVALVTGGTRGIGLGIARALAGAGWHLVLTGVRPASNVTSVLDELQALGVDASYVASDIASAADRADLTSTIRERYGALNAIVNNAGRAPRVRADLLEASEESFEELVRTNLQGPYFLTQALVRDMVARRAQDASHHACVVFVTSVSAEMASPNRGEYCVSKAGLAMTVKLFAVRLAEHGIPVFEVRPGIIDTDMTARVRDVYDRRIADGLVPERRWGTPDDVGRAVAGLVRGDLPYATGTIVHIDGGLAVARL
jgi:3-oxoacyl-[acyl-carrier protein] reductase